MGIFIRVDGNPAQRRLIPMLAIRITGNQLRAGRAFAGVSMDEALRYPITGIAGCCARAANGHAAAAPPSVAKNFRRSMWLAM
jgi:hypothetical protein